MVEQITSHQKFTDAIKSTAPRFGSKTFASVGERCRPLVVTIRRSLNGDLARLGDRYPILFEGTQYYPHVEVKLSGGTVEQSVGVSIGSPKRKPIKDTSELPSVVKNSMELFAAKDPTQTLTQATSALVYVQRAKEGGTDLTLVTRGSFKGMTEAEKFCRTHHRNNWPTAVR